MPEVCWTWYFLETQYYNINDNIVYQDNQCEILIEKNGKASGSNRTNNVNMQLFLVKYRINTTEVIV